MLLFFLADRSIENAISATAFLNSAVLPGVKKRTPSIGLITFVNTDFDLLRRIKHINRYHIILHHYDELLFYLRLPRVKKPYFYNIAFDSNYE